MDWARVTHFDHSHRSSKIGTLLCNDRIQLLRTLSVIDHLFFDKVSHRLAIDNPARGLAAKMRLEECVLTLQLLVPCQGTRYTVAVMSKLTLLCDRRFWRGCQFVNIGTKNLATYYTLEDLFINFSYRIVFSLRPRNTWTIQFPRKEWV